LVASTFDQLTKQKQSHVDKSNDSYLLIIKICEATATAAAAAAVLLLLLVERVASAAVTLAALSVDA
jgi:hypothetical protein